MIGKKLEEKLRAWTPVWRPRRYQATLVGMVVAAIVIPLAILAIPYLEILNDMAVQPKGKAQGYYGWFSDEALVVERAPVAGTLPMNGGWMPYAIPGGDEEARKLAGETLENPVPRTKGAIEVGRKYFNVFCIVCHGPRADGDGSIVGPNLFPAPPSLHTEAARKYPDGRIFHVITRGQNKMPSYADKLSPEERWSVIHYVRALQLANEMSQEERQLSETAASSPNLPTAPDPARGARLKKVALGVTLLGLILSVVAALDGDWSRFGTGYLIGYVFCWTIVLGSLFFVALQHITGSVWSVVLRRVAEMLAAPMWVLALLFVPLAALAWTQTDPAIFPWMEAHHGHGHALDAKAPYLNKPFFIARTALFFVIWVAFALYFVRRSLKQDGGDAGAGATAGMRKAAAPFLILFAFTLTFASFDWLMSLAPTWFSTIFGVYVFSGVTLAALAAITLGVVGLRARGQLGEGIVRADHLYSLGALLFAFTCFWGYIAFSQFMLIWYGNVPEETVYFVERLQGGWYGVTVAVALLRFAFPFFLLLSRSAKSDPRRLVIASALVLVGQFVDLYWVVMPQQASGAPLVGLSEIGPALLLLGLLGLYWAAFLRRHRPLAVGDPAFEKSKQFPPLGPSLPLEIPMFLAPSRPRRVRRPGTLVHALLLLLSLGVGAGPTSAAPQETEALGYAQDEKVGIDEKLGEVVPVDLVFKNEEGEDVRLGDLLVRPTVLTLVYFRCPSICSPLMHEVAHTVDELSDEVVPGIDYDLVTVSFDDREGPELARTAKSNLLGDMETKVSPSSWHFLTGDAFQIAQLADAVGFRFKRDKEDFVHAATVIFLTKEGKIVRYLGGLKLLPADMELALLDAAEGTPRTLMQRIQKLCFAYDPEGKTYVFQINRIILAVTILFVLAFLAYLLLRRRKQPAPVVATDEGGSPPPEENVR